MKFQFNKTELQNLKKQLKVRLSALPTLKNKESALRAEIKKYKEILKGIRKELNALNSQLTPVKKLYVELPELISVDEVHLGSQKIAGVRIPVFEKVSFNLKEFSLFNSPAWFLEGVRKLEKVTNLKVKMKIEEKRIAMLEYARKKTTQKVNLYEKVQIPEFEDAIIKIRRFIDDEENLDRAGQKIVKKRLAEL